MPAHQAQGMPPHAWMKHVSFSQVQAFSLAAFKEFLALAWSG